MTTGILVLHIILAAAMIGIILLQRNEGGALGMGGGNSMGGLMTTRGTANLLTRVTAVLATSFFITTIVLALMFKGTHKPKSILDDNAVPVAETAAPVTPPVAQESTTPLAEVPAAEPAEPSEPHPEEKAGSKAAASKSKK